MTTTTATANTYTLWGSPHSLYTGKIRSYLIQKGLPFREMYPSHPRMRDVITPLVRLKVVPILETPDGQVLEDTSDMIDHLETRHPERAMIPATPVQQAVAWLIGAFGSEGLLPVAMHYRWSYRAQQENFLRAEFGRTRHAGPDRDARLAAGLKIMDYFGGFLPSLGVTETTIPTVEGAYLELLDALDLHFLHHPYILGGHPSIADVGLMAPLYAHLARDPVPAAIMKNHAPNVYRWTERMNRDMTPFGDGEFPGLAPAFAADDAIPDTLEPVLRLIFQDWGPELTAQAACYNAWVAANPDLPPGHIVSHNGQRHVHPSLGRIEYLRRGLPFKRASAPHGLWHFERAAAHACALQGKDAQQWTALMDRTGGAATMALTLARPMRRRDYVLVLG